MPMKRFIQGEHRGQSALLPESLDDYVADTNPVRVVDVFIMNSILVNWV
jgi:transposase